MTAAHCIRNCTPNRTSNRTHDRAPGWAHDWTPCWAHELAAVVDLAHAGRGRAHVLHRVSEVAQHAIPGCDGVTFALWSGGSPDVRAATHPDLADIDDTQLQLGEGPLVTALVEKSIVTVPDSRYDTRWPGFMTVAVGHGVRCCLALACDIDAATGILQLFSATPHGLTRATEPSLALLVSHTRIAIRNGRLHAAALAEAEQMRAARDSRIVIEEAKGILMHAYRCDPDAAFERLRRMSQARQVKLAAAASQVVATVAGGDDPTTVAGGDDPEGSAAGAAP
ncbi:MAG: ANTAR domain-containing protein [Streptomycetales bacterium]